MAQGRGLEAATPALSYELAMQSVLRFMLTPGNKSNPRLWPWL